MNLIAEGQSLTELEACESLLSEGQSGQVRLYMDRSLTSLELQQVEDTIVGQGVILTQPIQAAETIVVVSFQKAIAPLTIIVAAVGLVAAAVLGWQLMSEFWGIPVWMWLLGGGLLVWALKSK